MESICIDSVTISLPCDLLRGCLQSPNQTWEGKAPDFKESFQITSHLSESDNILELFLTGVNVIFSPQSIRLNVCKAWKTFQDKTNVSDPRDCSTDEKRAEAVSVNKETVHKTNEDGGACSSAHITEDQTNIGEVALPNPNNEEVPPVLEKPKPKKRGRKPKSKTVQEKLVAEIVSTNEEEVGRKRYSLRGVKLSSVVMEAVKGKLHGDEEDEVDDDYTEDYVALEAENDETKVMKDAELQTEASDCEVEGGTVNTGVENSLCRTGANRQKMKSNIRGSLKMSKKFKELYLKEKGTEKKKILATIGNVYSKERRKKNINKTAICKYCRKGFCDYTGVDTHVKKFHKNEKDLKEYIEELIPLKQVKCSICSGTFLSRMQLQIHEDRDHSKSLCRCTVCGKVFKNLQFLRNHIKTIHLTEETHLCHLCSSKFKQAVTLKQHIEEIHEQRKNVTCNVCGKMFYRQAQLNRHSRIHDPNGKKIVCQVCGRGFNFECNLQRHLRVVHKPKSESFHCSYCGKGFCQKTTMSAHVQKIHFNLCPFVCKICQMPFMRSKQIEDHMAHTHNVTDFKIANPREKLFKYNRASEDLFNCSYCQESFCFKAQLVDHIQTSHLDVFPYHCEICKHGFLEKAFLVRHQGKAHNILPEASAAAGEQFVKVISTCDSSNYKQVRVVPLSNTINMADIDEINIASAEIDNSDLQDAVLTVDSTETANEIDTNNQDDISTAASVVVEISNDDNTIQYVIQGGEHIDMDSSNAVVHDIASLLLAAEQSLHENSGSVTLTTVEESDVVTMETNEDSNVEAPSVISISNLPDESSNSMGVESVEETAENSQEITVVVNELSVNP